MRLYGLVYRRQRARWPLWLGLLLVVGVAAGGWIRGRMHRSASAAAAPASAVSVPGGQARPGAATEMRHRGPTPATVVARGFHPSTTLRAGPAPPPAGRGSPALQADWSVPQRYRGQLVCLRPSHFPEKLLALTFDDGPDPNVTPRILASLAAHHARATFFVQGKWAAAYPEVVRQTVAAGHVIGNHSYSHPKRTSEANAAKEVQRTEDVILRIAGHRPTCFRPPYGKTSGALARRARKQGYAVVQWTMNPFDTRGLDAQAIASKVIHTPNPGDIVLMHDCRGHGATAEALPTILERLSAAGFRFVTVPELLRAWDEWLRQSAAASDPNAPPVATDPVLPPLEQWIEH